jgi:light-regulated signal transduction histidine kinase (bacteriophytochrome)
MARETASELTARDPERQVEFRIADGAVVEGDPRLLRVALSNLLENAWKFSAKQPAARIEFGVSEGEGVPSYFVRDDGIGFDMTYSDKLFGAFQRLHANGEFEGTGIGLASVQRVIRRHGGRVWAESEPGRGATFSFTLSPEGTRA